MDDIPVGTILLYYGSAEDLPEGWVPCDGRRLGDGNAAWAGRRTPDLRGRYPRGVGGPAGSEQVGQAGGKSQVLHSHAMPHTHTGVTLPPEPCAELATPAGPVHGAAGQGCGENHVHSTPTSGPVQGSRTEDAPIQVNPPHVKLLFVMKVW